MTAKQEQGPKPATSLPWSMRADGLLQDSAAMPIARMVSASLMARSIVDREERAAYIVHACNEYPRLEAENARLTQQVRLLSEAVRNMVSASDAFVRDTGMKNNDAITDTAEQARAALAQVKP